jgi:uncharacterized repeat protein (TIGR02543 family)
MKMRGKIMKTSWFKATFILSVLLVSFFFLQPFAVSTDAHATTYSHLLLIYPNTDVDYINNGVTQHYTGSMSEEFKNTIIAAFENLPALIEDGSGPANVSSTYNIVEISRPVTQLTYLGGNDYWLSPEDIDSDLKQYAPECMYDSVSIIWNNGPISAYWGLGGVFINNMTSTYSSLIAGQQWWWSGNEAAGGPFLHEWLHGVCRFYSSLGYPMPEGDADGAGNHGYVYSQTEGWMSYYRDLMQGHVWEPNLSIYTGITEEAWDKGTPRTGTCAVSTQTLTVNKTGTGSGTVSGSGAYDYGTTHQITATASTGSTFAGWSGDPDCADGSVTMNTDKTCTATFKLNKYTLTVNKAGTGSGTVSGGGSYDYGTTHQITATAFIGSTFTGWSGGCTGTVSPLNVLVDKSKTCTANFSFKRWWNRR